MSSVARPRSRSSTAPSSGPKDAASATARESGCDLVVDKPLAITMAEQEQVERALGEHPERRLLHLLTLRGHPLWAGMREQVQAGATSVSF